MDEEENLCIEFLQKLKEKGKTLINFEVLLNTLQAYVTSKGLKDESINLLAVVIINTDLGATKLIGLIKCLVPRYKIPEQIFKLITTWCLSSVNKIPITVSIIVIQWIIGLWNYQLVDKKVLNIYYSSLFYIMLKKEKLEKHIAHLIYILTNPEDITRRDVTRLIKLCKKYSKPQKHIIVLLSLFKSYKPELVPERVESVNIESVWKPIPEGLQVMLQSAKARLEIQETQSVHTISFNWNTFEQGKTKKSVIPLLPSVRYFQIGSKIFKEKDTKSIFDISNIEELGKSHFNMELPCNAISLLTNTAGYHLLTFADFHYQSRFAYNLYNTLIRAFIVESEKFSEEEKNKLLDMTVEFSRYMQQGMLVVGRFLDEYLYLNTGEHQSKLLALLQWMTSVSVSDLQNKVLIHVQNMYYESSLEAKCEIIRTLRILITNLFVHQGFEECRQKSQAPFLRQASADNLKDIVAILTEFTKDLIVSGLNMYVYDILLLSEALTFYEEVCNFESRSTVSSFTLAPLSVIYGGFLTPNCTILSRICKLLLRYYEMSVKLKKHKRQYKSNLLKQKVNIISTYTRDIMTALWYDEAFTKQKDKHFLSSVSQKVLDDLEYCDLNYQLSISNHCAILPYKHVLSKAGLGISTKEDFKSISLHYYSTIYEFINTFEN
ncbi:centromere protein I [Lasioglossum baleicum]|uniref:centromere protein I n=1 Tax=Lasioglossum baleicum TaxID=434251 RepID=UPI003FCE44FF